jgi:hypothetical protein
MQGMFAGKMGGKVDLALPTMVDTQTQQEAKKQMTLEDSFQKTLDATVKGAGDTVVKAFTEAIASGYASTNEAIQKAAAQIISTKVQIPTETKPAAPATLFDGTKSAPSAARRGAY